MDNRMDRWTLGWMDSGLDRMDMGMDGDMA